jgi:hypothetical protein
MRQDQQVKKTVRKDSAYTALQKKMPGKCRTLSGAISMVLGAYWERLLLLAFNNAFDPHAG